jgi:hypothetical protein
LNNSTKQYNNKENSFAQNNSQFPSKDFEIINESNNKLDLKIKLIVVNKLYKEIFHDYLLIKNLYHNNSNLTLQTLLSSKNIPELLIFWTFKENGLFEIQLTDNNKHKNSKDITRSSKSAYELNLTRNSNYKYTWKVINMNPRSIKYNKMKSFDEKEEIIDTEIPSVIDIASRFNKIKNMFMTASEVIQLQSEKINLYSCIIKSNYEKKNDMQKSFSEKVYPFNYNSIEDKSNGNNLNNDKQIHIEKSMKISSVCNLDKIQEILINYQELKNKRLNSYLRISQLNMLENKNTIGIGESVAVLVNQATQFDDDNLTETNNLHNTISIINEKERNFIKETEPFKFYTKKERKKFKKNIFDTYNNKNYTFNKMPEMSKIYQIILQNKVPEGINFQFLKSNEQIFLINSSNKADTLNL